VALVALVAIGAAWPAISKAIGLQVLPAGSSSVGSENFTDGACSAGSQGVTLVADFGTASKRKPLIRCAIGFDGSVSAAATGWALFSAAGVDVAGTEQYPQGFVCRIDGLPNAKQQPCTSTPTVAQGSWVYFTSSNGSAWHFAMQGAAMSHPACGDFQGWRFVVPADGTGVGGPRVKAASFRCAK